MAVTALDIIKRAMRSATILEAGETPENDEAQDALVSLNDIVSAWSLQRLTIHAIARGTYTLTANQSSYTIGSGGNLSQARPIWIQNAGIIPVGTTIELPLQELDSDQWAAVGIKTQTATFPFQFYYRKTFPLGVVHLWPIATTAATLVLYTPTALTAFADLSTSYDLAPGYERALRYNLAIELCPEYGRPVDATLGMLAMEALETVKRANIELSDLTVDEALIRRSDLWNYYTGQPLGGTP